MERTHSLQLRLPSDVELVDLVHELAAKMAGIAGFDDDAALDVGLAVREAVVNAIIHGNRRDPSLTVDVTVTAGPDSLRIRVRDRGRGFDPAGTADPRAAANLLHTSGRGLLMMRAFVDDVDIRSVAQGTEVVLTKRAASPPPSA